MENKTIIIGGGIAAVLIGGFLILRSKSQSQEPAEEQQPESPMMFMSGTIPSSPGVASAPSYESSVPGNSGANNTGGGFDIMSLGTIIGDAMKGQNANAAQQIRSNEHTSTSAILAGINLGNYGGSASVNHSENGSVLVVDKTRNAAEGVIDDLYKNLLGRAPDAAGAAFWSNALLNQNQSIQNIEAGFKSSPEYQKLMANKGQAA